MQGDSKDTNESNPSLFVEVPFPSPQETVLTFRTSDGFRWHVFTALMIGGLSFLVWFAWTLFLPHFPWFFYVWTAFALSLAFHYFIVLKNPRQILQFHIAAYGIINIALFLTWLFTFRCHSNELFSNHSMCGERYAWFLIPLLTWGHLLTIHYYIDVHKAEEDVWIRLHRSLSLLFTVFIMVLWLQTPRSFLWFLLVLTFVAEAFAIHYNLKYHPRDSFRLHVNVFMIAQLALFAAWGALQPMFPWWIPSLAVWGLLLMVHYYLDSRKQLAAAAPKPLPTPPAKVEMQTMKEEEKTPTPTEEDPGDPNFTIGGDEPEPFTEIQVSS